MSETIYLGPSQQLAGVRKERHARKKDGKDVCYLIVDRLGKMALLSQKLKTASDFINRQLVDPDEPWTRVNTVGLWEILNRTDGRVGGWHKGRFRVASVDLESAPARFAEARRSHERAAVLGVPACYEVGA